jgi:hypothetical protein
MQPKNDTITPGCFGSPVIRSLAHPLCQNCTFENGCHAKSEIVRADLLLELRVSEMPEILKVAKRKAQPVAVPITVPIFASGDGEKVKVLISQIAVAKPSDRVTAVLQEMNLNGITRENLSDVMSGRRKPETIKPLWLGHAIQAFGSSNEIMKIQMRKHIVQEMKWGDGEASSHVPVAMAIMIQAGLVQDCGMKIKRIEN